MTISVWFERDPNRGDLYAYEIDTSSIELKPLYLFYDQYNDTFHIFLE